MKPTPTKIHQSIDELSFVIAPPPHIKSDVSVLKDDVQFLTAEIFKDRHVPAHISLFRYNDKKLFIDIIQQVETKAAEFRPFNIFLKDLKHFRYNATYTVYLDIINKPDIRDIFEHLIKMNANYLPLISVAKGLGYEQFSKAWPHLRNFRYRQDFLCDRISVIGRRGHNWLHCRDIMFGDN